MGIAIVSYGLEPHASGQPAPFSFRDICCTGTAESALRENVPPSLGQKISHTTPGSSRGRRSVHLQRNISRCRRLLRRRWYPRHIMLRRWYVSARASERPARYGQMIYRSILRSSWGAASSISGAKVLVPSTPPSQTLYQPLYAAEMIPFRPELVIRVLKSSRGVVDTQAFESTS